MKTMMKKYILVMLLLGFTAFCHGQQAPPPQDDNPAGGTPMGGSAPIGGGVAMLMAMGVAYGGKKYYDYRKKTER